MDPAALSAILHIVLIVLQAIIAVVQYILMINIKQLIHEVHQLK